MGVIFRNLPSLIIEATKAGDVQRREAYKDLKSRIDKLAKSEQGAKAYKGDGNLVPDIEEGKIAKKMHAELVADAEIFEKNNRNDLAIASKAQAEAIERFVPAEVTDQEINAAVAEFIAAEPNGGHDLTMKDMGRAIKFVKAKLPTADGKKVHDVVQAALAN